MLGIMFLLIVGLVVALVLVLTPGKAPLEYNGVHAPSISPAPTPLSNQDTLIGSGYPTAAPAPTASPYPTILVQPETGSNVPESSNATGDVAFSPSPISPSPPPSPDLVYASTFVPTPSYPASSSRSPSDAALSAGAKAGIAAAGAVVVAAAILVAFILLPTRGRRASSPTGAVSTTIPQGRTTFGDKTKPSTKRSIGRHKHADVKHIVEQIDEDDGDWNSDSFRPEPLEGDEATGTPQRSALLQAQIAALQARVARRAKQAQELAALLEQRQEEQQPSEQPQPSGLDIL
jgi:hypothetical protein